MTSFFRKRVAQKVAPFLLGNSTTKKKNVISSLVKISRPKGKNPQLVLPWAKVSSLTAIENQALNIKDILRSLRNQGLPTAEGIIDISLEDQPLGLVFTVDGHTFSKLVLMDICINEDNMAKTSCLFQDLPRKHIVVNCSAPAIGRMFDLSHFRCAVHSNFIANINRFVGHDVTTVCHVEDWGLASALLVVGYKQFGEKDELERNPNVHLSEVMKASLSQYFSQPNFKDRVELCFKKLELGDKEVLSVWSLLRDSCVEQYRNIYNKLGLVISEVYFDSCNCEKIGKFSDILTQKDFFNWENDDTVTVNIPEESKPDSFTGRFHNSPDSPLYLFTRKILELIHVEEKYNFDAVYYVSNWEERDLFATMIYLLEELGYDWSKKLNHVKLKKVDCPNMKRIKKNSMEEILKQSKILMLSRLKSELHLEIDDNLEASAEILGLSSLAVNDMKHKRNIMYDFNWEEALSFGSDTATAFQLCYAGLKGLQKDSELKLQFDIDTSPLGEQQAQNLIQHLAKFDEIVNKAYLYQEPYLIFQYLSTLQYFTDKAAYVLKLDIKSDRLMVIKARLLLLQATRIILEKGLNILGIEPLENI